MKDLSIKRLQFALTLISISIIAFQLVLIQIISFVQWYHFAYMIISIAMLGFGTAGTIISLFKDKLLTRANKILPLLMILSGLTMPIVVYLSQINPIRFDTMLFFTGNYQIERLLMNYILFIIPFLLGALAIGIIFTKNVSSIGKLYFSNLIGSGIGGVLILVLIWIFFLEKLPAIVGSFAVISGLILFNRINFQFLFIGLISLIILSISFLYSPELRPSEFKSRSRTLLLQDARIVDRQTGPYGVMEIISSPSIRNADGLSLKFQSEIKGGFAIFCNGDLVGYLHSKNQNDSLNFLRFTTAQLPFVIKKRDKVLILNSEGGSEILRSLDAGVRSVAVVEPNTTLIDILTTRHPELNDSVYLNKQVSVYKTTARSYLLSGEEKFDLVVLQTIDAFGGTSGLYSLREQFHLTKEAISDMLTQLDSDGVLMINVWLDYPPRNSLKILTTIAEVLENKNLPNPQNYLIAIKNWNYLTILIKATPITKAEEEVCRSFCNDMLFDLVLFPNLKMEERDRFNKLFDNQFYLLVDKIFYSKNERESLVKEYVFNISPATDDKPFFSQFLRWKNINYLKEKFGNQNIPFLELGYILLYVTLVQIFIVAAIFIVLPLFKIGFSGKNKFGVLVYFCGIGFGYMFIEIIFIQVYTIYFGNPIYSASAVICLMLICSGIGSYITQNSKYVHMKTKLVIGIIAMLLLIQALILKEILFITIHYSLTFKIIIALTLISPCAFFMGIPFPAGMKKTSDQSPSLIPWAWGINGFASVMATVLATVFAVELGFTAVIIGAALFYSLVIIAVKTF